MFLVRLVDSALCGVCLERYSQQLAHAHKCLSLIYLTNIFLANYLSDLSS